jgi:hypothetical protein
VGDEMQMQLECNLLMGVVPTLTASYRELTRDLVLQFVGEMAERNGGHRPYSARLNLYTRASLENAGNDLACHLLAETETDNLTPSGEILLHTNTWLEGKIVLHEDIEVLRG